MKSSNYHRSVNRVVVSPVRGRFVVHRVIGVGILCLFSCAISAQCPDYSDARPAQLLKNKDQIDRVANFVSELREDELVRVVKFGAYINRQGRIENLCCGYSNMDLTNNDYRKYASKLYDLVFSPATNGDETLRVFVSMSLVSRQFPGRVENTLLLNQLNSLSEFGMYYAAPQRIAKTYERQFHIYWGFPVTAEIEVLVGSSGNPSNIVVSDRNFKPKPAKNRPALAAKVVAESCFVPGRVENEPTEMLYLEGVQ